ncbi:MAG: hypothetical protein ACK56G_09650 [Pirellulaceae bacterium]
MKYQAARQIDCDFRCHSPQLQRNELKRVLGKTSIREILPFYRLGTTRQFPAPEVEGVDGELVNGAEVSDGEVAD